MIRPAHHHPGRRRTAVLAATGLLAAVLPAGTASAQSAFSADLRRGDAHVDAGMRLSAGEADRVDATGLDVAWTEEGLRASFSFAAPPLEDRDQSDGFLSTSYALHFSSAAEDAYLRGGSAADEIVLSLSREGVVARGTRDGVVECASTDASPLSGNTFNVLVPAACLPDRAQQYWVSARVEARDINLYNGDYLLAGDEVLGDYRSADLGSVIRPGTQGGEWLDPHTGGGGEPTPSPADRDPSDQRVDIDLGQDDALGTADLRRVTVERTTSGTVVVFTGVAGMDHEMVSMSLISEDFVRRLGVRVTSYTDFDTGEPTLDAAAGITQPGTWGSRGCPVSVTATDDTYRVVVGPECDTSGGYALYSLASYGGTQGNEVGEDEFGDLSFAGQAAVLGSRPATTARDYSPTCDGREPQTQFSDVAEGNPHRPAIECLSAYGITQGKGGGLYGPNESLSHGQIATFMVRTLEAAGVTLPEDDGRCEGAHGDTLRRLQLAGISDTYGCDRTFPVTRSLMSQYSQAAMEMVGGKELTSTTDWFADDEAYDARRQVAHDVIADAGVVTGRAAGELGPDLLLSRAQMATFLARLLDWSMANKA